MTDAQEDAHPNERLPALGVRQPWAELIVRGLKTIEVRNQPTNIRGTIYVYASLKLSSLPDALEIMEQMEADDLAESLLARQVLIGTVEVVDCRPSVREDATRAMVDAEHLEQQFSWILSNPQKFETPLEVKFFPYGIWFYPFRRKS